MASRRKAESAWSWRERLGVLGAVLLGGICRSGRHLVFAPCATMLVDAHCQMTGVSGSVAGICKVRKLRSQGKPFEHLLQVQTRKSCQRIW